VSILERVPRATEHPAIGYRPSARDLPDILCGPRFKQLSVDLNEKSAILREVEKLFRLFYGMVKHILTAKEQ